MSSFFFFNREKVPRVPETLLKKRKSLEQLKAARAKAQLQQKKVGGIPTFLRQFRGSLYCMTLCCTKYFKTSTVPFKSTVQARTKLDSRSS